TGASDHFLGLRDGARRHGPAPRRLQNGRDGVGHQYRAQGAGPAGGGMFGSRCALFADRHGVGTASAMSALSVQKSSREWQIVKKLLLGRWDPLCIKDASAAQDEYDSYVPSVLRFALEGRTNDLKNYLTKVELEQMDIRGDPKKNEAIA